MTAVKIERRNQYVGTGMLVVAALLLVLVYYLEFHAGCQFDGKSGIGGIEAMKISERYSLLSLSVVLASFATTFLGIYILTSRRLQATVAVFLMVLTFGVPCTIWLSLEGSGHGTQSCKPS